MRLEAIHAKREEGAKKLQIPPNVDSSQYGKEPPGKTLLQKLVHRVKSLTALPVLRGRQSRLLPQLGFKIPIDFELIYAGHRFGAEAAERLFNDRLKGKHAGRVLVVGCSTGHESEAWLKRRPSSLTGVDLYNYEGFWKDISSTLSARYGCPVEFRQAVSERLPFPDGSFDLIHSQAVMEHVRNVDLSMREMTRVLAPGGRMWHQFGPLYFTYGGDHCIVAYGPECAYDHILLDEPEYISRIQDVEFFQRSPEPDSRHWASEDQFSFLKATDYLEIFSRYLTVESVIVFVTDKGLEFRRQYPDKWREMLAGGVAEHDLLIDGLHVILRKTA